jgi:hypothetical protein
MLSNLKKGEPIHETSQPRHIKIKGDLKSDEPEKKKDEVGS